MPKYEVTTPDLIEVVPAAYFSVNNDILYLWDNKDCLTAAFANWKSIIKE